MGRQPKVVVRDRGLMKRIGAMRNMGKAHVTVGVHEGTQHHDVDGEITPMGEVAAANEFGTEDIPERSFLRSTFDERGDELAIVQRKALEGVADGKLTAHQALGVIGQWGAAAVQDKIASNIPPPNAPSTVEQKGSSTTLIETGQLRQAITYEIHEGITAPPAGGGE